MAEYIEREALLAEYDRVHIGPAGGARKLIEDAPAADVVPVVHGRWIGGYHTHKGRWVYTKPCCSLCSFEQDGVSNYCPNCGARMDGDSDEG